MMNSGLLIKNERDRLDSKNLPSPTARRTKPGVLNTEDSSIDKKNVDKVNACFFGFLFVYTVIIVVIMFITLLETKTGKQTKN